MASSIEFAKVDFYKIASEMICKKFPFINAVYADFKQQKHQLRAILASGQKFLNMITLNNEEIHYQIEKRIFE